MFPRGLKVEEWFGRTRQSLSNDFVVSSYFHLLLGNRLLDLSMDGELNETTVNSESKDCLLSSIESRWKEFLFKS